MAHQFPHALRAVIEEAAFKGGRNAVVSGAAQDVSGRYRRLGGDIGNSQLQLQTIDEALGYMVARLPATYAANARVFEEVRSLMPDFVPSTVLDVGAGPGTAGLAACSFWGFGRLTLVEPNRYLREVGQKFLCPEIDAEIFWEEKFWGSGLSGIHDLVVASYVLNEIEADKRKDIVMSLWDACSGVLVIVEAGTPLGFSVIEEVRQFARETDGCFIVGPCPQSGECPLSFVDGRWCHFSVRVERSKQHKAMKSGATLGYEDEKFSWVALSRSEIKRPDYRLIGSAAGTKVRSLQVCDSQGTARTLEIAKSSDLYKRVKKLDWGNGFYE